MPHAAEVRCRSWPAAPTVSSSMTSPASVARCPACCGSGLHCLEACSGREGLQVLDQTGEIPLIISDMRMPELDGMGFPGGGAPAIPRQLGHHAERHERDDNGGGLPPSWRGRLPAEAHLSQRASGPGESGAGEAGSGAAEPVLPAASGATGPGPGHADPGAVSPGSPDAGPSIRGQGRLYPGPLDAGESVRCRHRGPAGIHRAADWRGSDWEGSCTTSGRSGPARQSCTSPLR